MNIVRYTVYKGATKTLCKLITANAVVTRHFRIWVDHHSFGCAACLLTPTPLHVTHSAAILSRRSSMIGRGGTYVIGLAAPILSSLPAPFVPWLLMVGLTAAWVYAQIPCVADAQCLLRPTQGNTNHDQRPGAGCKTAGHRIRAGGWGPSREWAPRQTSAQAVDDG